MKGCFKNNIWWSCRELRPGPAGNELLFYKFRTALFYKPCDYKPYINITGLRYNISQFPCSCPHELLSDIVMTFYSLTVATMNKMAIGLHQSWRENRSFEC